MKSITAADLPGLTVPAAVPFELELPAPPGTMRWQGLEVLRLLPGRRLVVRARRASADADEVLKLFFGRGHRRYRNRERRGLERLAAAGLPVPRQLGILEAAGMSGLVLEYLPAPQRVCDSDQEALETIAGYLGRLHASGYRQTDQHLGNFVTSRGGVHGVDGDGVRRLPAFRRPAAELDNFALFVAQRSPMLDTGLPGLLDAYGRSRGVAPDPDAFQRRLARARVLRARRYLAKSRRDCSEFVVQRHRRRVTYAVRGEGEGVLARLLARPLDARATGFLPGDVLKAGNSATLVRTHAPGAVVVKRFNIKNLRHGLRRMLRRHPRYRRAWMFGQLLTLLDIPTARPLALVEERRLFWRGVAYLVQADLTGPDLPAEVAANGLSEARCEEVASLFRALRATGITHGDTKASNFLLHEGRVHLIDLDGMRLSLRGFPSDVHRFLDNWATAERALFEAAFERAGLL